MRSLVIRWVLELGMLHRSTDKSYPEDNRLITPRVHIDGWFWHLDVGSSHPGAGSRSHGLGCSPIKAVREAGVQNVVRQFQSPIRRGRRISERSCP